MIIIILNVLHLWIKFFEELFACNLPQSIPAFSHLISALRIGGRRKPKIKALLSLFLLVQLCVVVYLWFLPHHLRHTNHETLHPSKGAPQLQLRHDLPPFFSCKKSTFCSSVGNGNETFPSFSSDLWRYYQIQKWRAGCQLRLRKRGVWMQKKVW